MDEGIVDWIAHWSARNALSVPLLQSLADAKGFFPVHALRTAQLNMNQPRRLCQECQQDQCGKKLRTSKTLACEIWAHKVKPSVLPCRRLAKRSFTHERS